MKLYKKDTKGKTRFLEIKTEGSDLVQISGVIDTDNPIEHRKTCKGKNIGKSNETTPEKQAKLEMQSKIEEKLTEGYFKTIKEVDSEEVILPMLAKSYGDEKHKIDWDNCYIQPKLDGQRALGKDKLISRQGKIIENLDHIVKLLDKTEFHLDGECYAHGKNFQENMRLIKKYRKGETEEIAYHVYDLVLDKPFNERNRILNGYFTEFYNTKIVLVPTFKITSEKELKKYHEKFLSEGYEGSIVRWGNEGYKANGRSSNLLKYKDFQDITATIIDIEPAEQRPEWGVPVLKYSNQKLTGKNEFIFRAGMKYSHEERKEFLLNKKKYIGKTAEIRFFEYSEDGIPRFPIMVGIRLDK